MAVVPLGPFDLHHPIGKGGMGVVWRGVHRDTMTPVAVKVLTQRVSRDERSLRAFRNEVRSVAGLDHPGIVWVLDYGEVDRAAETASDGKLVAGSPYLVMELATGGTLSNIDGPMNWFELRNTLLVLLDALAHAHARGVIHRDLKPGNVLVSTATDLRPGLKITDFGIAHAREETVTESLAGSVVGTLHYMAPEQIRADWRDYGPWTDLYALGCIAYRLCSGRLPFHGKKGASLMMAQLQQPPPALVPQTAVSPGFEDWLRTMLRKESWDRFQCAADAALALTELEDPDVEEVPTDLSPLKGLHTPTAPSVSISGLLDDMPTGIALTQTMDISEEVRTVSRQRSSDLSRLELPGTPQPLARRMAKTRPPLPDTWRRPVVDAPEGLQGAGLGLWGLRAISMVGRDAERDALWGALQRVHANRAPVVALLSGPKGIGTSRLAEWIGQRAVESGGAQLLRIDGDGGAEPQEPIRRTLRRFFRVQRLDHEERLDRVLEVLEGYGAGDSLLATRLSAMLGDGEGVDARYRVLAALFKVLVRDRPLVVWIDDAQEAGDALRLAQHLLKDGRGLPVLVVATLDSDALQERESERQVVEDLRGVGVVDVPVGPLGPDEHVQLVEQLVGLEPELAGQVAERTEGHPQFAVQLIGDWVQRSLLVQGAQGFELTDRSALLPRSVHQVWLERLDRVLHGLPEAARIQLERAAVLGNEVDDEEWQQVCDHPLGTVLTADQVMVRPVNARLRLMVVERLLTAGFADERDDGWSFSQGTLRETLEQSAKDAGRWEEHHLACANWLQGLQHVDAERLGRHLLEAGQVSEALSVLFDAVARRRETLGPNPALELLDRCERLMTEAGLSARDPRWIRAWVERAALFAIQGNFAEARDWARRARKSARAAGAEGDEADATFLVGVIALYMGQGRAAIKAFRKAEELMPRVQGYAQLGACIYARGLLAVAAGDGERARQLAAELTTVLVRHGLTLQRVWTELGGQSLVARHRSLMSAHLRRVQRQFAVEPLLPSLAMAWRELADAAEAASDPDDYEDALAEVLRLHDRLPDGDLSEARLRMAALHLERQSYAEAHRLATLVSRIAVKERRRSLELRARAALAFASAGLQDWTGVNRELRDLEAAVDGGATLTPVSAWSLARMAELAWSAGYRPIALRGWQASIDAWKALGEESQAVQVHDRAAMFGAI